MNSRAPQGRTRAHGRATNCAQPRSTTAGHHAATARHGRPEAAHDGDTNRAPCVRREKQRRTANARPARNVSAIVTQKSGAKPAHHWAASTVNRSPKQHPPAVHRARPSRDNRASARALGHGEGASPCAAAPMPEPTSLFRFLKNEGIQLAVGPQPLRLRNHNSGLAHRIMVKRLATSPHDPLGIQLAVGPQPLRLRNHNSGLAHRIMVKRLATSPHDPLGITDSACKNQLVVVSVKYGPFNPYIPIRSTTIGKSRVAIEPIAMHTSWRSNSDIASVTSIGYPRMSASGESSTTMHRLLHASGSHPIPPPNDPKDAGIDQLNFHSAQLGYLKLLQMGNADPNKTKAGNKYEVKTQYEELSKQINMQHAINQCYECMRLSKEISQLDRCNNRQIISCRLYTTVYQPGNHRSLIIGARQPITARR
ncbi:kinesin-4-like [Dorcoceras hygrometricum]|uniref:Kinesin-4-like n=1 Tax=Dorcoceras hygrometricum TaxID=472368 RepID=A0A2Z7CRP0_9LAMI|nr:kinesin-4-like [Dorcoceras hygrometricum]